MRPYSSVRTHPALLAAGICLLAGFLTRGADAAVLWGIVGYFAGKSLRSVVRTLTGGPAT